MLTSEELLYGSKQVEITRSEVRAVRGMWQYLPAELL